MTTRYFLPWMVLVFVNRKRRTPGERWTRLVKDTTTLEDLRRLLLVQPDRSWRLLGRMGPHGFIIDTVYIVLLCRWRTIQPWNREANRFVLALTSRVWYVAMSKCWLSPMWSFFTGLLPYTSFQWSFKKLLGFSTALHAWLGYDTWEKKGVHRGWRRSQNVLWCFLEWIACCVTQLWWFGYRLLSRSFSRPV